MTGSPHLPVPGRQTKWPGIRAWLSTLLVAALLDSVVQASDLLRSGATASTAQPSAAATANGAATSTTSGLTSSSDRLARTTQALAAVQAMQQAARNLALAGANNLKPNLPAVPLNSYGQANGLVLAAGVPKDLLNPTASESAALWTGANLPVLATQTTNGTDTSTVTITQTQQQALLNWQSFNIGKNTTLNFDQSAGGTNVGQWIAFNFVRDPTANPTQILGKLQTIGIPDAKGNATTGGQIYLMNSNGIIFGGSAQVNAHALVASSLPINPNLIQNGLLVQGAANAQFLFSAIPTSAFDPAKSTTVTPPQTPYSPDGSGQAGSVYGDIEVQAGAQLSAPTNADHVGGKIALVGPNVANAGTIASDDGQTILAAGLQVGLAPHVSSDPTLRGLDVYVGKVADLTNLPDQTAGTVTNTGLIQSSRSNIFLTGSSVAQDGVVSTTTSVAYNGRIDLVAGYNAVPNPIFDPQATNGSGQSYPFILQSNEGNNALGAAVANSGPVALGAGSLLTILPELASKDRIVGDLNLPSQINLEGGSVYFGQNAQVLAPGATTPLTGKAYGSDGIALDAGVSVRAGNWYNQVFGNSLSFSFVHATDAQQIYMEKGAAIDVAGITSADITSVNGAQPSVTENIVSVELRGPELANSPAQQNGPLRGQTIQVDLRDHGPWDPTLNNGLGGYTWVGTPVADTSGWVGLATHTVGELSVNGGSVSLNAGGAVVLNSGTAIDVSGGSLNYTGALVQTTKLSAKGHIYDIAQADPNLAYDGIYNGTTSVTDAKWGVTTTSSNPLAQGVYESGYTQGGNGGKLVLTAPFLALDGSLQGATTAGAQQRTLAPNYNPTTGQTTASGLQNWLINLSSLPTPSQLSIQIGRQELQQDLSFPVYVNRSPTPAAIYFSESPVSYDSAAAGVPEFLDAELAASRKNEIDLRPSLFGSGKFGFLAVDNTGDNVALNAEPVNNTVVRGTEFGTITVPHGVQLDLGNGGYLGLAATNLIVGTGSTITATGGTVNLQAYNVSTSVASEISALRTNNITGLFPDYDPDRGQIIVSRGAIIRTAGKVADDRVDPTDLPQVSTGGLIALSGNTIQLATGSTLDVSGGANVSVKGKVTYGAAGSITLSAGTSVFSGDTPSPLPTGGLLELGSSLQGFAGLGQVGGSLNIKAPAISVQKPTTTGAGLVSTDVQGTLDVTPGFFNAGGFNAFSLTGLGLGVGSDGTIDPTTVPDYAVSVAAGTVVAPSVLNWSYLPGGGTFSADVRLRVPVKLTLATTGLISALDGTNYLDNATGLLVASGAVLKTDDATGTGGAITLKAGATGFIDDRGTLTAHGGQLTLQTAGTSDQFTPNVRLAPTSIIDASGIATWSTDTSQTPAADDPNGGLKKTNVVAGGTIRLTGNIVAESGARLNVAGGEDTIWLAPGDSTTKSSTSNAGALVPVVKDSNGGNLSITSQGLLFIDPAAMNGQAGGSSAQAGNLVVSSTAPAVSNNANQAGLTDPGLTLVQTTPMFAYQGIGKEVLNPKTSLSFITDPAKGIGQALIGSDAFAAGRFGSLVLQVGSNALQVQGKVQVTAGRSIAVASGGILSFTDKSSLSLAAPYVKLGQDFLPPAIGATPLTTSETGTGTLAVKASSLIDVGNLVVLGAGKVTLDASQGGTTNGSIRGDGTLDVAGDLTLQAGQIYPPSGVTFNVIATKSITIKPSGLLPAPSLPLSAGGELNLYAPTIDQGGVLRAPLGKITLGASYDANGATTLADPLSVGLVPVTSSLTLEAGSITSVSAVDPSTGVALTIPYGLNVNGDTWISPSGTDITNAGPAQTAKAITLAAYQGGAGESGINIAKSASIDLSGGGDISSYRFVPGTGGTIDLLGAVAGTFAIVPGYQDLYAPYAPFNNTAAAQQNLGNNKGYVLGTDYTIGERIHLAGGSGLPAGDYTVLPARYGTLPGAYVVTPQKAAATSGAMASLTNADGSVLVSGYVYQGLDPAGQTQPVYQTFSVSSSAVLKNHARYDTFSGNLFFNSLAAKSATVAPPLGIDAGQLVLAVQAATDQQASLTLHGSINLAPSNDAVDSLSGRLGLVDITTTSDIRIASTQDQMAGELLLDPKQLSGLGSVLIGGTRASDTTGTIVTATTQKLTVDSGVSLSNPDLILASKGSLTIADGVNLASPTSASFKADPMSVSGDGALVRVSSDASVSFKRTPATDTDGKPVAFVAGDLKIGAANLVAPGVILDSAVLSDFSDKATLGGSGSHLTLSSGQISIELPGATGSAASGLVLSGTTLSSLNSLAALTLTSYSSIDFYGAGSLGLASTGQGTLQALTLRAAAITGYDHADGTVTLAAATITLDNNLHVATVIDPTLGDTVDGTLAMIADNIRLGDNQISIDGFGAVALHAGRELAIQGASTAPGVLAVSQGDLSIQTPVILAAAQARQTITTDGKLNITSAAASGTKADASGLGADLSVTGAEVVIDSAVKLPSGQFAAQATAGDISVGGTIDTGGVSQNFFDVVSPTDGGRIALTSASGDVSIAHGTLNVGHYLDDQSDWKGNAGALAISAVEGRFVTSSANLSGHAGSGALGGSFSLDVGSVDADAAGTSNLSGLQTELGQGGFDRSFAVRVRSGDVNVAGDMRAHQYALSADQGSIIAGGTIDASGLQNPTNPSKGAVDPTGGNIDLTASGSVTIGAGAWLTAAGYEFNNAGKGGAISLAAGSYSYDAATQTGSADTGASVSLNPGARIDLGVSKLFTVQDLVQATQQGAADPEAAAAVLAANRASFGDLATGTLHLRETQAAFGNGAQFTGLGSQATGASRVVLEGFQVFDLSKNDASVSTTGAITQVGTGGLITTTVEQEVRANGTAFAGNISAGLLGNSLIHVEPGAEIVNSGTATNQLLTVFKTGSNLVTLNNIAANTKIRIPGGLPAGDRISISQAGKATYIANDGTVTVVAVAANTAIADNVGNARLAYVQNNSTGTVRLSFLSGTNGAGTTPFTIAVDAPISSSVASSSVVKMTTAVGDLTLANTWDLSSYRFGANVEPGVLTLRANNNLVFAFDASLSDGFDPTNAVNASYPLLTASLLPAGTRSWSYRLVGGSDYTAADSRQLEPLSALPGGTGQKSGSVLVGRGGVALPTNGNASTSLTITATVPLYYQTIRTGTGDIGIYAGRDVQLLNPLAAIYTAGTAAGSLAGFDVPNVKNSFGTTSGAIYYAPQYTRSGGDVTVLAQNDVARYQQTFDASGNLATSVSASSKQLPTNWLYRRSLVGANGLFSTVTGVRGLSEIQSTSWWIDFSNFFGDVGALGGGNVVLSAGNNVSNVQAAAPTNARMPGYTKDNTGTITTIAPNASALVELGGGDVSVRAGANIDGGVYYVERGNTTLTSGGSIVTNNTRYASTGTTVPSSADPLLLLSTTLFLGKGSVSVSAGGDVLLGSVANPFWLPQGAENRNYDMTFFNTFAESDSVKVSSLGGQVTIRANPSDFSADTASLAGWYGNILGNGAGATTYAQSQPWLALYRSSGPSTIASDLRTAAGLYPGNLTVTAFSGDINLAGTLNLAPARGGRVDLLAGGNLNGLALNGMNGWATASINLSDASPGALPGITSPISFSNYQTSLFPSSTLSVLKPVDDLFSVSGSTDLSLAQKLLLHAQVNGAPLHAGDLNPVHLYASNGDVSGFTLYSAKFARVVAGNDISDIALYVQNANAGDRTLVAAGRDIVAYDPNSPLRKLAAENLTLSGAGITGVASPDPDAGDIQVSGPGTLEVLAGRDLTLGTGAVATKSSPAAGITSVGAASNPYLPQNSGADIITAVGVGSIYTPAAASLGVAPGLATTSSNFPSFIAEFLDPSTAGTQSSRYLPVLATYLGSTSKDSATIWSEFGYQAGQPVTEKQASMVLAIFNLVLRNAARDRNDPASSDFGKYTEGFAAIAALFPGSPQPTEDDLKSTVPLVRPAGPWVGNLSMATKEIKTFEGGNISLLVPGGGITVGRATDPQTPDQGILTQRGGGISIFTADSVNVGTSRIFTLKGGDEIIWSTWGNIAAGSGSKTVFSAPPTRVLIDPQSGDVQNDLAGLATGSGIGVLATLSGVKPGDVDLIAPVGTIDAGDAGIRSSGNLNIAARVVLNSSNIQVGGASTGTPPPPPAPNLGSLTAASSASASANSAATEVASRGQESTQVAELPSLISVEVLGYGGGEGSDDDDEKKKASAGSAGGASF